MSHPQDIFLLRTQLLGMARLSQRALDCAIKGYELGSLDFCLSVRAAGHELQQYSRQIEDLCRQPISDKLASSCDRRFSQAAPRLRVALHAIYNAAANMAQDTMLFLEKNPARPPAALHAPGELVNGMVRLCVMALFMKDASYAAAVLRGRSAWPRFELIFDPLHHHPDASAKASHRYMLAITQSFGIVTKQTQEIADTILFWLRGKEGMSEPAGHHALDFLFEERRADARGCLPENEIPG